MIWPTASKVPSKLVLVFRSGLVALGLVSISGCQSAVDQSAQPAPSGLPTTKADADAAAKADAEKPKCKPDSGMKPIPAGTFTMGSDDGDDKEKPSHQVNVAAFCIDMTEVTTAAYAACVINRKCRPADTGGSYNSGVAERENHPINGVNWYQASIYCKTQGLRLPTEEEWEYAARGTDGRIYPWGNAEPSEQLCWNRKGVSKPNSTCAVNSLPKGDSPFGLADMAGNVWEWTSSGDTSSYAEKRSAQTRVSRGGSWYNTSPSGVRSAFRGGVDPAYRLDDLGFRCADSLFRGP